MRLFRAKKPKSIELVPLISVAELKRRLDQRETVLVLDVRQPSSYSEYPGKIPGSVRIPPAEVPDRFNELPRNRPIVPY